MPPEKTAIRLRHMLDHVLEAMTIVQGKTRTDLMNERVLNLALVRLLEVAGEAANQISREEQAKYPKIPWSQAIGLRNY